MDLRYEYKHEISAGDLLTLRRRLRAVMAPDPHAENGSYTIRSLYFDTPGDRALREQLSGVSRREKFRLRSYNGDLSLIKLENKSKVDSLCGKQTQSLSLQEARALALGGPCPDLESGKDLIRELLYKRRTQLLEPKVIVDYTREPFVYAPGNVRVTLDYGLRLGPDPRAFLEPDCPTLPPGGSPIILEVKWDEFLPDIVRDAVGLSRVRVGAFSKYARCRIYG